MASIFCLEEHEVDQEHGADQHRLQPWVELNGEGDAQVVRVREHFPGQAGPALGDAAHFLVGAGL